MEGIQELTEKEKKKAYMKEWYENNKCEHNKRKVRCKECDGSAFCEHGKHKENCKKCGGSGICEHGKRKAFCKDCDGSSFCEHGKRKYICKTCDGSQICEHDKLKTICITCCGGSMCIHNKRKNNCKDCNLPLYLINKQRGNIIRIFKQSNIEKTKVSMEYLGCTALYFINFIKSKMTPEMNWDNIHLDHIKPVCSFNLDNHEDFLDCCNYTNLQPLLANDNLTKSGKWNDIADIFWNENIKGKEYLQLYIPK